MVFNSQYGYVLIKSTGSCQSQLVSLNVISVFSAGNIRYFFDCLGSISIPEVANSKWNFKFLQSTFHHICWFWNTDRGQTNCQPGRYVWPKALEKINCSIIATSIPSWNIFPGTGQSGWLPESLQTGINSTQGKDKLCVTMQ